MPHKISLKARLSSLNRATGNLEGIEILMKLGLVFVFKFSRELFTFSKTSWQQQTTT